RRGATRQTSGGAAMTSITSAERRRECHGATAEQKISEEQALHVGLERKAREFKKAGAEIYSRREVYLSRSATVQVAIAARFLVNSYQRVSEIELNIWESYLERAGKFSSRPICTPF